MRFDASFFLPVRFGVLLCLLPFWEEFAENFKGNRITHHLHRRTTSLLQTIQFA
jgi:hypothetical protein